MILTISKFLHHSTQWVWHSNCITTIPCFYFMLLSYSLHILLLQGHLIISIPWAVRLSCLKMHIHIHFSPRAILIRKVRQTDLVFGIWSGIISGSVQARLQVSMCSSYDLCHHGLVSLHKKLNPAELKTCCILYVIECRYLLYRNYRDCFTAMERKW